MLEVLDLWENLTVKVSLAPPIHPRRGAEVRVGNVYINHGRPYYKVVLAVVTRDGNRPWKNVVLLHIDATGRVLGSSNQPIAYVQEHQDLVGHVVSMPELTIEWNKESYSEETQTPDH